MARPLAGSAIVAGLSRQWLSKPSEARGGFPGQGGRWEAGYRSGAAARSGEALGAGSQNRARAGAERDAAATVGRSGIDAAAIHNRTKECPASRAGESADGTKASATRRRRT